MNTAAMMAKTNQRKLNKQIEFENYKRKNYLEGYHFFINNRYGNTILYVSKHSEESDIPPVLNLNEIKSPHTLVKYVKLAKDGKMRILIDCQYLTFYELKENILIERLAGLL